MYCTGFSIESSLRKEIYPFFLPIFHEMDGLSFSKSVTVFVGENGSGKSTLLESLAIAMNLPAIGSANLEQDATLGSLSEFVSTMRTRWSRKAYRGFFFRAEDYFGFVKRLGAIDRELSDDIVDFEKQLSGTGLKLAVGSIYGQKEALKRKYGDLNSVSHGEGFLKVLQNRIQPEGIYLIDEPEAALSPQRQLSLYALLKDMAQNHHCQFIIATHSPILMTLPDSQLLEFDETIREVHYEETEHFTILKQFLDNPEAFTRFL